MSTIFDEKSEPAGEYAPRSGTTPVQGYILIALVLIGLVLLAFATFRSEPSYEYKTVAFFAESNERTGTAALKYASINVDEQKLQALGTEGWELVDGFLEMETAFPNFGSSEYVTGLQPNVRPQRVVLIFKRKAR